MKKIMCLFIVVIFGNAVQIGATEMQLFGGFEFGVGSFKVDNDFAFTDGFFAYMANEETTSVFLAPGLAFGLRVFSDNSPIGFVFRDRAIFITNYKIAGKSTINGLSASASETYSINDDFFISIMDFAPGVSVRHKFSDRFMFYSDLGVNLTIMNSEYEDSGSTLDYLGFGVYSALAFQMYLTHKVYLELGINAIINAFSSQKGKYGASSDFNRVIKYEDTGRFDLSTVAAYLTIGWRLDLEKLRN